MQKNRTKKIEVLGNSINLLKLLLKTAIILILVFICSTLVDVKNLGSISLYNRLFTGRERLPFGENPELAYNFTLNNLSAMFASHKVSENEKKENELRIFVIGDSSIWGILLKPEETLAGLIKNELLECNGKIVNTYNLGYPTLSLTKDVMIAEFALRYDPDIIIWPITLESFPIDKQVYTPLVENNLEQLMFINQNYELHSEIFAIDEPNPIKKSVIGQRKEIADLIRLQIYGFMWAATGIDQYYPQNIQRAQVDLEKSAFFHDLNTTENFSDYLAFYALDNMKNIAGEIPVIFINEPIMISNGANSDIRYNFYYPKWAYDYYRRTLRDYASTNNWYFLDLWDLVDMDDFTNSAIHLTQYGEKKFSSAVVDYINSTFCNVNME